MLWVPTVLYNISWPLWAEPYASEVESFVIKFLLYVDYHYLEWLAWLFTPIVVAFLLPGFLLLFLYGTAVFLHVYKFRIRIREDFSREGVWSGARSAIATFWDAHGWIWHGHELHGLENLPEKGPCLIVYYHGTLPVDVYYVIAKCLLLKQRIIRCVGDKFLFKIPGWHLLMKVFHVTPGSLSSCVEDLQKGHILCISPGGVREAFFSNYNYYNILWGNRQGFARIALKAKVPIIPMFTENCREAFRPFPFGKRFFRWLYEKTRLPLVPLYGGFPAKLRTFIGAPLNYPDYGSPNDSHRHLRPISLPSDPVTRDNTPEDSSDTSSSPNNNNHSNNSGEEKRPTVVENGHEERKEVEPEHHLLVSEVAELTKGAIEKLILDYQILPGSIARACLDRIPFLRRWIRKPKQSGHVSDHNDTDDKKTK